MSRDQDEDSPAHQDVSPNRDAYVAGRDLNLHFPPSDATGAPARQATHKRPFLLRGPAISASVACACILVALAAAFGAKAWPFSPSSGPSSPSGSSSHLTITSVSFRAQDGQTEIVVSGVYNPQPGDGYIYVIARPSLTPSGTSQWLASPPVTPGSNGQWTTEIVLNGPRQRVTVFAVLAGGCPPGEVCGPNPDAIQIALEQEGPAAADYSTAPKVAS
jgi:hypothetical protein